MTKLVTLEFYPGPYTFCAGHFTVFSKEQRERLHGHNYSLAATVTAAMREPGLTFNYKIFKARLKSLCDEINCYFLLPKHCPYLTIDEEGSYYYVTFNQEKIPFLKSDVVLLPIENTTLEDLSQWFVEKISGDKKFIHEHAIAAITIKVFNGPEQSASASWESVAAPSHAD